MSTVQTSVLSSFSAGELLLLFNSKLSMEKLPTYELIGSHYPHLLWLQHSISPYKMQCGYYFKPGLALLIAFKVATALYRNVLGFS